MCPKRYLIICESEIVPVIRIHSLKVFIIIQEGVVNYLKMPEQDTLRVLATMLIFILIFFSKAYKDVGDKVSLL